MDRVIARNFPFVVGRVRIDNYLMAVCEKSSTCTLIDGTYSITGIHIGQENHKSRDGKVNRNDYEWNIRILRSHKGLHSILFNVNRITVVKGKKGYYLTTRKRWKREARK